MDLDYLRGVMEGYAYWHGMIIFAIFSWTFLIQMWMLDYSEMKSNKDLETDAWGATLVFGLCFPLVYPAGILFLIVLFLTDLKKFTDDTISFQKQWYNKFVNIDYISVFLPVLCVLTLFLLD